MDKSKTFLLAGSGAVIAIIIALMLVFGGKDRATITVNDAELDVLLADTVLERQHGLSNYSLDGLDADGMLFVFDEEEVRDFWMKDMNFALDVVWIKGDKIVSADYDIQPPEGDEEPERMTSNPVKVDKVLELPAGKAESLGLNPGVVLHIDLP